MQTQSQLKSSLASTPSPRPRVVTGDGVFLHHADWGQGAPLLFVASAGVPGALWDYQVAGLMGEFRCITYDRRGHGRSDQAGSGHDYDTLADDLASVIETLGLTDLTLVGHSMGCGEIVRYLTRHGAARVKRLVLIGATLPFMQWADDNRDGIDPAMAEMLRAGWAHDFPAWVKENTDPFFLVEASQGMKDWLGDLLTSTPVQVCIALNRAVVGTDFRDELKRIETPTMLLHGDQDVSAPLPLTSSRTVDLMPNAELKVFDHAAHGVLVTHIDAVNADIRAFAKG